MRSITVKFNVLFLGAVCAVVGAGSSVQAQSEKKSDPVADSAWASLAKLAAPTKAQTAVTNSSTNSRKTPEQKETEAQQRTATLKQTAQAAHDFYTAYPNDSRASEAKKIEVYSGLQAVSFKDSDRGAAVFKQASDYRSDATHAIKDRVAVASLMERQKYSVQNSGKLLSKDSAQHERVADSLRLEFGERPEVYSFYLGVVNTADFETAKRVAQKVVLQAAPAYQKAEAQVTLDRYALIGKRRDESFKADDGRPTALTQAGKPSIVVAWSSKLSDTPFAALKAQKNVIPADARWVYVSVNSMAGPFNLTKGQAPFPGTHIFEPFGTEGAITKLLKIRRTPFVYVFDRNGQLAGYGDISELPTLVKLIAR